MKTTPEHISYLRTGEIFVFGSNTQGRHGAGAARYAHQKFGAEYGVAEGLTGKTYAIPTVDFSLGRERYPLGLIDASVQRFLVFANEHQEYTFLVTPIGCGLGGFTVPEIAGIFKKYKDIIPNNITLPASFIEYIEVED